MVGVDRRPGRVAVACLPVGVLVGVLLGSVTPPTLVAAAVGGRRRIPVPASCTVCAVPAPALVLMVIVPLRWPGRLRDKAHRMAQLSPGLSVRLLQPEASVVKSEVPSPRNPAGGTADRPMWTSDPAGVGDGDGLLRALASPWL